MNHNIDGLTARALESMGYRWRHLYQDKGHFLKPIGHGCLIFNNGNLDLVCQGEDLKIFCYSSTPIVQSSEVSLVRQIMKAEAEAIDGAKNGAKNDRHGEIFAFYYAD